MTPSRLHVIACKVFQQELEVLSHRTAIKLTIQYLEMGLHEDTTAKLHAALQDAIDTVGPQSADAIALAYGLCNSGIVGLQARRLPVVIPRAHDCIGMLLGNTERYLSVLGSQTGTYFQSPGWVEHLPADRMLRQQFVPIGGGLKLSRDELVARYGQENAEYLFEQFGSFGRHYSNLAYVSTPAPTSAESEKKAADIARQQGWSFERVQGDLGWLRKLIQGDWDEKQFLLLNAGQRVALRYDSQLIAAEMV